MQSTVAIVPLMLVVLGGVVLGVVPIVLGIRQKERLRRLQHAERLRALEMGVPLPADVAWPAAICIALGGLTPVGALGVALIATLVLRDQPGGPGLTLIIWGAALIVSITALRASATLAHRLFDGLRFPGESLRTATKPLAFDPDAFDTVSRRG